jgi:hypothetical protein
LRQHHRKISVELWIEMTARAQLQAEAGHAQDGKPLLSQQPD